MSVRKREWVTRGGEARQAWVADYTDLHGKRRLKTFGRKKDADAFASTTHVEVREGTHVAASASASVKRAGDKWIESAENAGLERATIQQYRQHLDLHIQPFLGTALLSKLNVPTIREFEDRLREGGRSPAMVRKVMSSLGSLLADAQERGLTARNPVRDMRGKRRRGKDRQAEKRQKGKLKVGVDIPTREEIRAIAGAVLGRWRPLILTAIFTGLRASELRGLRWENVDLAKGEIHVRERADRFNEIGNPKSSAGERTVPLTPIVVKTLKEWKLKAGGQKFVFANGSGNVDSLGNIINRGLIPPQLAAGITKQDEDKVRAKYTGMHALRHFYASWCINPKSTGGLELSPKVVQERMGHSSIRMTMDVYGHLFPRGDDAAELAAAEKALLD